MKGDYTRSTFRQFRHYRGVRMQQGRVQLDADWNEQLDIDEHLDRTETRDVIGVCGAPIEGGGFEIVATVTNAAGDADLIIAPGRMYVDGLLCELDASPLSLAAAPAGSTVEVETLLVDGTLLEVGHWVELSEGTTTFIAEITAITDSTLTLSAGVGGGFTAAAVLRRAVTYRTQPHYPDPAPYDPTANYVAYLEVWQRHLTETEDADLREPALGGPDAGPDTTTRLQTVWQLRLEELAPSDTDPTCADFDGGWLPSGASGSAQLRARAQPAADVDDVCLVPPEAGYRRLEHQLYRVEVHQGSNADGLPATFKWSRDNGSVVYPVTGVSSVTSPAALGVARLGRDDYLRIAEQDVVEVVDDTAVLLGTVNNLYRVTTVDAGDMEVSLDGALPGQLAQNQDRHPLLRRWDHRPRPEITVAADGAIEIVEDAWLPLEAGVEIQFAAGSTYHTGDYWLVPARYGVAEGVLWPTEDATADAPAFQHPHGIERDYCVVAVLLAGAPDDCRPIFPPLTALTSLRYVGGDGQEGVPDPALPGSRDVTLPASLQVRVSNGAYPVAGATVGFAITGASNGRLQGTPLTTAEVVTDPDGVASCVWQLDGSTPHQVCEARLLDAAGDPLDHEIVRFNATLSTAARTSYDPRNCPDLRAADVRTVQQAIDELCGRGGGGSCCVTVGDGGDFPDIETAVTVLLERGQFDICICLRPGHHEWAGMRIVPPERERTVHLRIAGCGPATRVIVGEDIRVMALGAFTLSDMDIDVRDGATISVAGCSAVEIDRCLVSGLPPEVGLVRIHHVGRAYVGNSTFEAFRTRDLFGELDDRVVELIDAFQSMIPLDLYAPWTEFSERGPSAALEVAERSLDERHSMADELDERLRGHEGSLSLGEAAALRRVIAALRIEDLDVATLYGHLVSVRRNILRVDPGIAVEFDSFARADDEPRIDAGRTSDGPVIIENNDVVGAVSFYGVGHSGRDPNLSMLRVLLNQLRQTQTRLGWVDADVHLRDNRLTRLEVSREILNALESLIQQDGGELDVLLRTMHCTDNVIDGARNMILAGQPTLSSNEFSLSSVRGSGQQGNQSVIVASVVGDAGVYTGNHGATRGHGNAFAPQIVNVARVQAQAANLELNFVF